MLTQIHRLHSNAEQAPFTRTLRRASREKKDVTTAVIVSTRRDQDILGRLRPEKASRPQSLIPINGARSPTPSYNGNLSPLFQKSAANSADGHYYEHLAQLRSH
jgi:hypothetical protein